jgi:hypothetical protein
MNNLFSLTPGFSPVSTDRKTGNRFNGFCAFGKPLKRLTCLVTFHTRLKPGVNETTKLVTLPRKNR